MERVCGDQFVGIVQTTQEFFSHARFLRFIPVITVSDIRHGFRKQDDSARHDRIEYAA